MKRVFASGFAVMALAVALVAFAGKPADAIHCPFVLNGCALNWETDTYFNGHYTGSTCGYVC